VGERRLNSYVGGRSAFHFRRIDRDRRAEPKRKPAPLKSKGYGTHAKDRSLARLYKFLPFAFLAILMTPKSVGTTKKWRHIPENLSKLSDLGRKPLKKMPPYLLQMRNCFGVLIAPSQMGCCI
jgi:hypothetical protein